MKKSFESFLRERTYKIAEQEYETPPSSTRKIAGPEKNPDMTRNADEIGSAKSAKPADDSHLISFASKPGQMFRASGAAPKDTETHDVEGSNLKFSGPKPSDAGELNAKNIKDAPSDMPGMKPGSRARRGYYGDKTEFVKFVPNEADDDPKTGMKKPGASGVKDDPSYTPPEYKNPAYGDKPSTPNYKTPIRPDGVTSDMEKAVRKSPTVSQNTFDNLPSDADAPGAGTEHTPSRASAFRSPKTTQGLAASNALKAVRARRTSSAGYMEEEVDLVQNVERGVISLDKNPVKENVNNLLTNALALSFVTPYVGLQKVAKVLANFHLHLPKVPFLEGAHGVQVFDLNQFGEMMGMKDNGEVVTKVETPYHVYFEYLMNDMGRYDIFCEIVDDEELDDLMSEVEDDMEEDEVEKARDEKLDESSESVDLAGPETGVRPISGAPNIGACVMSAYLKKKIKN